MARDVDGAGHVSVTHIAGVHLQVNARLRQRCAWCGATLIDVALDRIAFEADDEDPRPATWPAGELIEVEHGASWVVPHRDGAELPGNACGRLDPDVTT